jgi:hypothetical protein
MDGLGSIPGQGQEIFLFCAVYTPTLGPNQPPVQWGTGALSPGVKRPERETDYSSPSSAEIKSGGAVPPLSHTS